MKPEMTLKNAAKDFWLRYFDFKGRTTRSGYWLGGIVPAAVFILIMLFFTRGALSAGIFLLLFICILIPSLSMTVRRNRDAGLTGRGFLVLMICRVLVSWAIDWEFSVSLVFYDFLLNLLFEIIPFVATDYLTTRSKDPVLLFFLRPKPLEGKEEYRDDMDSTME